MEFRVELLVHLLCEAKFAELGEYTLQESLLIRGQVVFGDFEKHWLGLTEVAARDLTQEQGHVLTNTLLGRLFEVHDILKDESGECVLNLALKLLHRLLLLCLLNE